MKINKEVSEYHNGGMFKEINQGYSEPYTDTAPFDKGVLNKCCEEYDIQSPDVPFMCTVRLARSQWGINPTKLNNVCEALNIPLNHHEALSDARASAKIVMIAESEGWEYPGL